MTTVDSRRFYALLADVQSAVPTATSDTLNLAEELIDQYVGPQQSFQSFELIGRVQSSPAANQFNLQANKDQGAYQQDFFKNAEVEIVGGTGAGQIAHVLTNILPGLVTTYENFSSALDSTSIYKIYQLGKFPRMQDVYLDGYNSPVQYYKPVPIKVRDAVIEQCKFIIKMGANFFITDSYSMDAEVLDKYRYQRKNLAGDINLLVSPTSKQLLKGIMNRKGQFLDASL